MVRPIFIFSLPRSGSTLLQRILMMHPSISSVAEPWLLLPQLYSLKEGGQLSEYGSLSAARGITDFMDNLPNGKDDYNESLRDFVLSLYQKHCKAGERYFLDKTPRYYHIIQEIEEVFPEAKFIFLFRNPLQVYTSMLQTWSNNRLRPFLSSHGDVTEGYTKLSKGFLELQNRSISVTYEDLVTNPERTVSRICNYLDIEFTESLLSDFTEAKTAGRLGDPSGVKTYKSVSKAGLDKWKKVINTRFRKRVAKRLINSIDAEALAIQGYDKEELIEAINNLKSDGKYSSLTDIKDYYIDLLTRKCNLQLWFDDEFKWSKRKYIS